MQKTGLTGTVEFYVCRSPIQVCSEYAILYCITGITLV